MFYGVCASYITIYLAVIFLIIGNTVISVQFLTNQQKIGRRYQTLIRLGATSNALCRSARKQINWYFGIPVFLGAAGSIPAMASLFSLFVETGEGTQKVLLLSASGMILLLLIVELIYILEVKKLSDRYLLYLMVPEKRRIKRKYDFMKRIGIVEDEAFIREELGEILEKAGYEVVAVEDFEKVEEELSKAPLDIVLLDLNLPGKSGFQICRELKHKGTTPVCVLTSRDQMADELRALELGADEYKAMPERKTSGEGVQCVKKI